jgi:hypothetical protein
MSGCIRMVCGSAAIGAVLACSGANTVTDQRATVFFQLDAPLCSSIIPVQFHIDDALVGKDTFVVHLANEHTKSRAFVTTAGQHKLGGGIFGSPNGWFDTTVTLRAGETFTDTLHFYCS